MNAITWLICRIFGEKIGTDYLGNQYFIDKRLKNAPMRKQRRWVVCKDSNDPSHVPPLYHAWLHHTLENFPTKQEQKPYDWILDHQPNMTGTPNAYHPSPPIKQKTKPNTGLNADLQAWRP
ncbi:MAG: NADH-ubiquinone oxidoreductase subunit NDUFA12 family protein [Pseudomonadota bacterium]